MPMSPVIVPHRPTVAPSHTTIIHSSDSTSSEENVQNKEVDDHSYLTVPFALVFTLIIAIFITLIIGLLKDMFKNKL